jgi:hypothetical protein
MTSTYRQIALQPVDFEEINQVSSLSLNSLRLALGLLFFGMMLTLSVTLSLAAQVVDPSSVRNDAPNQAVDSAVLLVATQPSTQI